MNTVETVKEVEDPDEIARQQRIKDKPLLSQCYNLMDFESVAKNVMKKTAWGYYSSAADDEIVRTIWIPILLATLVQSSSQSARV